MKVLSRVLPTAKGSCLWVLLFAVLLFPPNAFGLFIDVVSQQFSINGTGFGTFPPEADLKFVSFKETSNRPLSRSVSNVIEFQSIIFGSYSIDVLAEGGFTSRNAFLHVHVATTDEGNALAMGQASATMTFRPLVPSMLVNPFFTEPGENLVSLVDLTANLILLAINSPGNNQPRLLFFDTSHLYAMSVISGDLNNATVDLSLNIQSVPEPSIMLFLATGLFGLGWYRARTAWK